MKTWLSPRHKVQEQTIIQVSLVSAQNQKEEKFFHTPVDAATGIRRKSKRSPNKYNKTRPDKAIFSPLRCDYFGLGDDWIFIRLSFIFSASDILHYRVNYQG